MELNSKNWWGNAINTPTNIGTPKTWVNSSVDSILQDERYANLEELIDMIEEPNRSACKRIYLENKSIFKQSKGSSVKHQAWEGWYLDHVRDIMNIAIELHGNLSKHRPLHFSLSDALLILFLHDLEKPWKYAGNEQQKAELRGFQDYKDFIKSKIIEYWFQLTDEHWNGLKYVHGEWSDYDPKVRIQWPLAAFVHICDTISARIWFDKPEDTKKW